MRYVDPPLPSVQHRRRLWRLSAHRPSRRGQRPRPVGRAGAIRIANRLLDSGIQGGRKIGEIGADRPLPGQERLPVILEILVIHPNGEGLRLDTLESGVMEKARQPAGNGNRVGEQAVARDTSIGIDCDRGVPKHALKHEAATRVPHDSRDSAA